MSGGLEAAPSAAVTGVAMPEPDGALGTFVPLEPVRVVDTRDGTGGRRGTLGQQQTMTFDPAGDGVVPTSGVAAVLLNVTGTEPTQPTHVRVWPAGDPRPTTSSLNLERGQSRPNQVVVPLGDDGRVALFNNAGSTHLVVDVQGYYSSADGETGGGYHPVPPARVLDTRYDDLPLYGGEEVWLPLGVTGLDPGTVAAVDVNLTVTEPTTAGHLTAWPGDTEAPTVSNVNFAPGQTVANHAVVPVTFDELGTPGFALRASAGATQVVVDVQGWYDDSTRTDGLLFSPSPTTRLVDTREGGTAVAPGGVLRVPVTGLPPAVAQVVNVTATGSTRAGHLTAWSGDGPRPSTSTLNFARAEDSPNMATVRVGAGQQVSVGASSSAVHVVVDHLGYFW